VNKIRFELFQPLLNDTFNIYFNQDTATDVRLIDVSEQSNETGQTFSLVFRAAKDQVWPQGTYQVHHANLNTMHIFLVPIGPDKEGFCYEAIFNFQSL